MEHFFFHFSRVSDSNSDNNNITPFTTSCQVKLVLNISKKFRKQMKHFSFKGKNYFETRTMWKYISSCFTRSFYISFTNTHCDIKEIFRKRKRLSNQL